MILAQVSMKQEVLYVPVLMTAAAYTVGPSAKVWGGRGQRRRDTRSSCQAPSSKKSKWVLKNAEFCAEYKAVQIIKQQNQHEKVKQKNLIYL